MNRIILFGPPATGKGTQAKMLQSKLGIPHISTGDLLRDAIEKKTEIGKKASALLLSGDLVPDEMVIALVKERLSLSDCASGFILDGFPRDVEQARRLSDITPIDLVILIESKNETIIERVIHREMCPTCGTIYGITLPSKKKGVCDKEGAALIHRADDNREAIAHRLEVYHHMTAPLIAFYGLRVRRVNGEQQADKILTDILGILAS